jgi:hypothetical protein
MLKIVFEKEKVDVGSLWNLLSISRDSNDSLINITTVKGLKHKTFLKSVIKFFDTIKNVIIPHPEKYHKEFEELDIDDFLKSLNHAKKATSISFNRNYLFTSTPSGNFSLPNYLSNRKRQVTDLNKIVLDKNLVFYIESHLSKNNLPLHTLFASALQSNLPVLEFDSLSGIDDN